MENEILQIEEQLRAAQLSHDVEVFERVLSDDFQFISPQGKVLTKSEDLAQYKSGHLRLTAVEVADRTVKIYGPTAVVRFQVKFEGSAGPHEFSSHFRFTRIYAKDSGAWKMVGGHASELKL